MLPPRFSNCLVLIYYCTFGIALAPTEASDVAPSSMKFSTYSSTDSHETKPLDLTGDGRVKREGTSSKHTLEDIYAHIVQSKIVEGHLLTTIRDLYAEMSALKNELSKVVVSSSGGCTQQPQNKIFEDKVLTAAKDVRSEISALMKNLTKSLEEQLLTTKKEIYSEISTLKKDLSTSFEEKLLTVTRVISTVKEDLSKSFEEQLLTTKKEIYSEISTLKKDLSKSFEGQLLTVTREISAVKENCEQQPQNKIFEDKMLTAAKDVHSKISSLKKDLLNDFEGQLLLATRKIHSEISTVKEDLSKTTSECLIESSIQEGLGYPVGQSYRQLCPPSARNREVTEVKKYIPGSCKEIQDQGSTASGVYEIQPIANQKPFKVLCDMETRGGGWTVIQKRFDGSVDFNLGWREYKFGFGDLAGEFWIGLENIYKMTGISPNELLVEITDRDNTTRYAHYKKFGIGSELYGYSLNVLEGFSGDASDSLAYHKNMKFSTKDFDRDLNTINCAEFYSAGWWFNSCFRSNLNGFPINVNLDNTSLKEKGLLWIDLKDDYNFSKSRMMIKR